MSFLFVDHIESETENTITGRRVISPDEPYLIKGVDKRDMLIPSLIGEAIGQLAGWKAMSLVDFDSRFVAGVVEEVQILGDAFVDDTLQLTVDISSIDEQRVQYDGHAFVNNKLIFSVKNSIGPKLPVEDFIDKNTVIEQYLELKSKQKVINTQNGSSEISPQSYLFDTVSNFHENAVVVAEKTLKGSEPYLRDHFPKKPVLPLTILLHAKVQLAESYINTYTNISPKKITARKIKMGYFIEPGESIRTEMRIKTLSHESITFTFKTMRDEKRVCVCELTFG